MSMPPDLREEVIALVRERLPRGAKLVLLSLTGSRAFGWAAPNFDYDVHGIYVKRGWWDYMHLGKPPFDINIFELEHLIKLDVPYRHGETILNFLNPFYVDPHFPIEEVIQLLTKDFFPPQNILHQIRWFEDTRSPRAALHAYRMLILPMYIFVKGKVEMNMFKAMEELGLELEGPELCKELYTAPYTRGRRASLSEDEYEMVRAEIWDLYKKYESAEGPAWDEGRWLSLKARLIRTYYTA
mgnify:CR=1 FL=1